MKFGSKGMTCLEFVNLMKERGYSYNEKSGGFLTSKKKTAGKTTRYGYRTLALQKDNVIYTFCEHRCVWTWFNGEIPDGLVINHKDFDRSNNRIENLEVVTQTENLAHSRNAGHCTPTKGEKNGRAIWTDKEAQAMKYLRKNGWQVKEITKFFSKEADLFNVTRRVTVFNTRTDKVLLEIIGNLSIQKSSGDIDIIVETDRGVYKKHFVSLNDWTTYVVEDVSGAFVDKYHYEVNFLPEMIVPVTFTQSR